MKKIEYKKENLIQSFKKNYLSFKFPLFSLLPKVMIGYIEAPARFLW